MEDGFWFVAICLYCTHYISLNPYSDGRWFLVMENLQNQFEALNVVLILILMEDGFWFELRNDVKNIDCLNPYSDGRWFLVLVLETSKNTTIES